jgi:serine/threonine protein phosphatase PrpC
MNRKYEVASDTKKNSEINQDSFFVDNKRGLYIVADGIGSQKKGEVASRFAADALSKKLIERFPLDFENTDPEGIRKIVEESINETSIELFNLAASNIETYGMGTTVVCCVLNKEYAVYGNVGDSPIYVYRASRSKDKLLMLTQNHTVANYKFLKNEISFEESLVHPESSKLTKNLGQDTLKCAESGVYKLEGNEYFLVCSDSVPKAATPAELEQIFQEPNLESMCSKIKEMVAKPEKMAELYMKYRKNEKDKNKIIDTLSNSDDTTFIIVQVK